MEQNCTQPQKAEKKTNKPKLKRPLILFPPSNPNHRVQPLAVVGDLE